MPEQIFLMLLPIIFMVIALVFDSSIFALFGGISAILVGLTILDTMWAMMIYVGLGIYFMFAAAFAEED